MATRPPDASADTLFDLMASHRITAIIHVAARLGIADHLACGPMSAAELARKTGADLRSLQRLLRALVTIGICRETDERFELTEVGAHLAEKSERSLKAFALFEGEILWRGWSGLIDSVRTGKTASELAGVSDSFALMGRDPEVVRIFNEAMASLTGVVIPGVLAAYDFSEIPRLLDVGGGHGELFTAILKANMSMRGAVFDLPRCAEGAKRQLDRAGVSDRGTFIAGDFFESLPRVADAIIMKSIIHDWDDGRSKVILRNCRSALSEGGRLLLVERLMSETPGDNVSDRANALSDLNMLRGPGGAERTEREYRSLLAESGFKINRTLPAGRFSVIEAIAA